MVDQATNKKVETHIERDDPIQALRTYRSGVLNDRFEIVERIANRGMSSAYLAIDRHMPDTADRDRSVTIKILKRNFQALEESILALQQAAEKAQQLDHPNIVKVYGLYRDKDTAYLITEHLAGESLSQRMGSGALRGKTHRELLRIINEMGKALTFAHEQGVVHGDFMPANVILADNGEIKVLDFGLARALRGTAKEDSRQLSSSRLSCLIPAYASPETLESHLPDPRDDVFALACMSYELLVGEHPFQRMRASSARDAGLKVKRRGKLSGAQWRAFQAALEFDREKRTPTVNMFLETLNAEARHRRVFIGAAVGIVGVVALTFGMVGPNYFFKPPPYPAEFSAMETQVKPADSTQDHSMAESPAEDEDQGVQQAVRAPQNVPGDMTQAATPKGNEPGATGEVSLATGRRLQAAPQKQERPLAELKNARLEADSLRQANRQMAKASGTQQTGQDVARLLTIARSQLAANRLTLPAGKNALETYRQILQAVPDHKGALMGIDRIKSKFRLWALYAEEAGDWQRAQANLEKALAVDPQDAELTEALRVLMESRNTAELTTRQAEQNNTIGQTAIAGEQTAERSEKADTSPQDGNADLAVFVEASEPINAQTPDLKTLMTNARQHLAAGRLMQPKGDNAWELFSAILDRYPGNPEAQAGLEAVPQQLESIARKKQQNGKLEEGLRIVEDGLRLVPGHAKLRALKDDISGQLQAQQSLQKGVHAGEPAQTRSETLAPEQDEQVEPNKHRIRSYGSFF